MSLVSTAWSNALYASLQGKGLVGSRLKDFTDAVAQGSVGHVVGKSFTTTDVGSIPGIGVGTGTGLSGFSPIASVIYSTAVGYFGQAGSKLQDVCDSIESVHNAQLGLCTLSSNHTPVFLGSGSVDAGSIPVVGMGWGSLMEAAGGSFNGLRWPDFSKAIGIGCAAGYPTAAGSVTITGSFTGSFPPGPLPGAGTGSGSIS